jgi:hypothetical protein
MLDTHSTSAQPFDELAISRNQKFMLLYTACVQLLLSQSAEWPWLQLL